MAGPANSTITQTHLDLSIPEVWANEMLGYLPGYLSLLNTVTTDFGFDEIKRLGDKINISKRGTLVAKDKEKGKDVELQQPSNSEVEITLDKHKEITFSVEDVARAMEKPDTFRGLMMDAAMVLAESAEDSLAGLYSSAGIVVDATAATSDTILQYMREARRRLITAKVPKNAPLFAYVSEFMVEDTLNGQIVSDASKLGTSRALTEGSIGRLAGFDWFETQMVKKTGSPSVYHNLLYPRSAMAIVPRPLPLDAEVFGGAKQTVVNDPQTGFSIRVTMSYNPMALAPQVTLDALWGVGVLRGEHLVDLRTDNV